MMWNWLIDVIPEKHLDFWGSFLGITAIVLTLLAVVIGWVAFDVSARASSVKDRVFSERIGAAEAATKPKPLKERLIACLNEIDPRIMQEFAGGQPRSKGVLKPYQLSELQKLAAEPGADEFIALVTESSVVFTKQGPGNQVQIELKPKLAE